MRFTLLNTLRSLLVLTALACALARGQSSPPPGTTVEGEGDVTLTWVLPTKWTDGTDLLPEDRAGFVVFYDTQSRFSSGATVRPECMTGSPPAARPSSPTATECYAAHVEISNGSAMSRSLQFELEGDTTLHFAIITRTTNGEWSEYSNEASKTIRVEFEDERVPEAPEITTIDVSLSCTTSAVGFTCTFIAE